MIVTKNDVHHVEWLVENVLQKEHKGHIGLVYTKLDESLTSDDPYFMIYIDKGITSDHKVIKVADVIEKTMQHMGCDTVDPTSIYYHEPTDAKLREIFIDTVNDGVWRDATVAEVPTYSTLQICRALYKL